MHHRIPLPRRLGPVFHVSEAAAASVGRGRSNAADLHRPFLGVRAVEAPATFLATAECYKHRLRDGHRFCGTTAARIWGLPVPWFWTAEEPIYVAVPTDASPPRGRGVRGRRVDTQRGSTFTVGGLETMDPISTVFLLAPRLDVTALAVLLDALVTPSHRYPGLRMPTPFTSIDGIHEHIDSFGPFPGVHKVRRALQLARPGVDSPRESRTRLLIVAAGLPEPVVQHQVHDASGVVATVDLAYPDLKIAIEYEGDGHRTDRDQWRTDIRRQRRLEELGWIVIRVTELDLSSGRDDFLGLLRRTVTARRR
jgi:hypothetical protein